MSSGGRRRMAVVVGLLLTATLVPGPAAGVGQTAVGGDSPLPTAASATTGHAAHASIDYVIPPSAARAVAGVRRWPGSRIRYYETLPQKWQWSLDRAIEHWNSAGANLRFVKVSQPSRAQLTIGYGPTGYSDGVATIGPARNAYVRLSEAYRQRDEHEPWTRVWVGRLLAHELGHVVGFQHTQPTCSLMVPLFYGDQCDLIPPEKPGYYYRRWIDKPLLTRFVDAYGGSPRRPPKIGLIAPLPPQLRDVTFSGGELDDRPVAIEWTPPDRVPEGSRVQVGYWRAASCDRPDFFESVKPAAGSWVDDELAQGSWCFAVRIVNRYGAARPAFVQKLPRWAPTPAAPAVSYLAWDRTEQAHRFSWVKQRGTWLEVVRNPDDPATCITSYADGYHQPAYPDDDGNYSLYAYEARECLTFFAVNDFKTSTPVPLNVAVPAPAVTPTVGELQPTEWGAIRATVTLEDPSYRVGIEVLPGSCPGSVPDGLGYTDAWEMEPNVWEFYPEAETGPSCALFAAVDYTYGTPLHGPVVMREFAASG